MNVEKSEKPIARNYYRPHPEGKNGTVGPAVDMYEHAGTACIPALSEGQVAICSMSPDDGPFFLVHIGSEVKKWLNQTGAWDLSFDTLNEAMSWCRVSLAACGEPT